MAGTDSHREDQGQDDRLDEVLAAYLQAEEAGTAPDLDEFIAKHAEFADDLREFFADQRRYQKVAQRLPAPRKDDVIGRERISTSAVNEPTLPPGGIARRDGSPDRVRYFGDYELTEEIARGGMGVVFKARQVNLKRNVALKMILVGRLANDEEVKRFQAEARAAARLEHPNIVPIYEIGQHDGQHYFTMAYVDGESLAHRVAHEVLPPLEAARIMCQVARAIAFAHVEGVIHRDLKPANILLDRAGEPHVTDFGLAKRVGDAEATFGQMTATGQVLGTPSYMPPEQAAGTTSEIGPLSDVYSLGAVLYCLVCGRPPFQAASPLDTLIQVMHDDPAPPRVLNAAVPCDLETICLKCLEKDPRRRYRSAQELADELDRFLRDEPIQARRASGAERAWRWLKKQKRSVALTAAAVVATLVFGIAGISAWLWYEDFCLGYISFDTDHPPLIAEIIDERGESASPPFTVPTQEPVAVPAGEYRLRVSSAKRWSQSYRFSVPRGAATNPVEFSLNQDEQLLGEVLDVGKSYELFQRAGKSDVVLFDAAGIRYPAWNQQGGSSWSLDLATRQDPAFRDAPGLQWPWDTQTSYTQFAFAAYHPRVVADAPDLDSDGIEDLVVAAAHQAWILAVSSGSGKVLWFAGRGSDLLTEPNPSLAWQGRHSSTVVGVPLVIPDQDGDDTSDFVAAFADARQDASGDTGSRRWLESLSGRTGQTLWKFEYDDQWFAGAAGADPSDGARWFVHVTGNSSGGGGRNFSFNELARTPSIVQWFGKSHIVPYPPRLMSMQNKPVVVTVAGSFLVAVDAKTGVLAREPLDCGAPVLRPPQLVNLVGDAEPEWIVVQDNSGNAAAGGLPTTGIRQLRLSVWSLSSSRIVWGHSLAARLPSQVAHEDADDSWPLVADVDLNGSPEVLVPNVAPGSVPAGRAVGEIEVLDGATGQVHWHRMLKTMDQQIDDFTVGPDINRDGWRDVFVASLSGQDYDLYVDTLSGKDGSTLHWSSRRVDASHEPAIRRLAWWQADEQDWPSLLVLLTSSRPDSAWTTVLPLSIGGGDFLGSMTDLDAIRFADADDDQALELFSIQRSERNNPSQGGRLQVLRGTVNESWRRLGGNWTAAPDLDGDRTSDLLAIFPGGFPRLVAISGRTAKQLWESQLDSHHFNHFRSLDVDLDGDRTTDVVVYRDCQGSSASVANRRYPFAAISGRTGEKLWSVEEMFSSIEGILFADARDFDGDHMPEVVFSTFTDWDYPFGQVSSTSRSQHWLAVVSGQTGAVRWRCPLSVAYGSSMGLGHRQYQLDQHGLQPAFGDLNGDGTLDLLVPAETLDNPSRLELRALDGRDGELLWRRSFPPARDRSSLLQDYVPPSLADVDGDGHDDVLGLEYVESSGEGSIWRRSVGVFALRASDGMEMWHWRTEVDDECGRVRGDARRAARRPRPLVVRRDREQPLVGIGLWGGAKPGRVVFLDQAGQERSEFSIVVPAAACPYAPWVSDLDQDGRDEMLLLNDAKLQAYVPADPLRLRWEWPLPRGQSGEILEILPALPSGPVVVAVQSGASLYGVSGESGQKLWTIVGPQPRTVVGSMLGSNATAILREAESSLSTAIFQFGNQVSAARRARLHGDELPHDIAIHSSATAPVPVAWRRAADRRWQVPPPWGGSERQRMQEFLWFLAAAVLSLTIVYLPSGVLYGMMKRRRWTLRSFLLWPVLLGVIVLVLRIPLSDRNMGLSAYGPVLGRLSMAAMATPVIAFVALIGQHLRHRRWREPLAWCVCAVLLGLLMAGASLASHSSYLLPGERFSLVNWDMPLCAGIFATACIATVILVFKTLVRMAVRIGRTEES